MRKVASGSQYPTKYCHGYSLPKSNHSSCVGTIEGGDDIDAGEVDEEQRKDGEPIIVSDTYKAILTVRRAGQCGGISKYFTSFIFNPIIIELLCTSDVIEKKRMVCVNI